MPRRYWVPSLGAAMLDGRGALAVLVLDLPAALVRDPGYSYELHLARLGVAVLAALCMLLLRRALPLAFLGVAVADALLRTLGAYSLGFAAYAVARYEPDDRLGTAGIGVAALISMYVWRWHPAEVSVLPYFMTAVLFVLFPAAVGTLVRSLAGTPPQPAPR